MILDIVLLRTFVAVVEANGFTRAAGFVNLTRNPPRACTSSGSRSRSDAGFSIAPLRSLLSPRTARSFYPMRNASWRLRRRSKPGLGIPNPRGLFDSGAPDVIIDYFHIAAALRRTSGNPTVQPSGRARAGPALGHKRSGHDDRFGARPLYPQKR